MFFNDVSDRIVVAVGALAALVGYGAAGLLGAAACLAVGLASATRFLKDGRFYRG